MFNFILLVLGLLGFISIKNSLAKLIESNQKIYGQLQILKDQLQASTNEATNKPVVTPKQAEETKPTHYIQEVAPLPTANINKQQLERPVTIKPAELNSTKPKVNIVPQDDIFTKFFKWLFADFILKVGGLMVISGLAFLINLGISSGVITPPLRILLAVVISSVFLALGVTQVPKKPLPGQILLFIGTFGLTLSVLGARHLYNLIETSNTTLILILIIQVLGLGIAYLYKKQTLAIFNLLIAGFAPFIVGATAGSMSGLLGYGLVLYIAMLPYVTKTGWKGLSTVSMVIGLLYSGALSQLDGFELVYWILAYLAVFNFANLASIHRNTTLKIIDLINSVLINLISIVWIGAFVDSELKSLLLVGVTVFYIVTSIILKNKEVLKNYIQLQFLSGLIAFGFALITQYSDFPALLSLLLFAEISIGIFVAMSILKKPIFGRLISILNFVPLLITITEYPELISSIYTNNYSIAGSGLITLLYAMCAVFLGIDYWLLKKYDHEKTASFGFGILTAIWISSIIFILTGLLLPFISGSLGLLLVLLLVFYLFSDRKLTTETVFNNSLLALSLLAGFRVIWSGFYTLLGANYYVGASLVVYSIVALLLTRYSHKLGSFWKYANYYIFAFIVFRLFAVEFWAMEMFARFLTFVAVGALFISTPYIAKKQNFK